MRPIPTVRQPHFPHVHRSSQRRHDRRHAPYARRGDVARPRVTAMSVASTPFVARRFRADLFPWAIALATGLEYFDNTIFSFFTSYIAGGINASTDELVWSSSAYAVASVLAILQQQWWVERVGYRRYIGGCLLLFAAA